MRFLTGVGLVVGACLTAGQGQGGASLLVLSKKERTLAVVDPVSLKVLGKVPVGNDPHEVIASTDGATAYVSNYGFGAFHSLAVVDLVGMKAMAAVELGALAGPHGLTFGGGKTWFTAEGAKAVGRYDPSTKAVDLIVGTGQNRTHMLWVSDDCLHVVTTNVNSGTVSFLDWQPVRMPPPPPGGGGPPQGGVPAAGGRPRMDWNETVVKVGNGSEGFDVSPDGREIWVGNAEDGTISVIDRERKEVVQTIGAEVKGVNRLKFTPDGSKVLVATLGGGGLTVMDGRSRKVVKRLAIGKGAAGIVMEPSGKRAFVACSPDDYVAVIDLAGLTVAGRIDAGGEPDGMAWAVRP